MGLSTGCTVESGVVTNYNVPEDIDTALQQLPRIASVETAADGIPYFVSGDLGHADRVADIAMAQTSLAPAITAIAPVFRLRAADLSPVSMTEDELGMTHVKYMQMKDGLDVVGADLIVHISATGVVRSVTSSARGDATVSATPSINADKARSFAAVFTPVVGAAAEAPRLTYVISSADGSLHLAWESRVVGVDATGVPVDDLVYVDAHTGGLADRHPQIQTAKNRSVYSASNGTSLPGSIKRTEGAAATSDTDVNAAYDNTGTTYDVYKSMFNRDSYDNAGAKLTSTVHYSSNYVNAYWNGSQMVYGDGDGSQSIPLARALDVTAHELTHAVTERTAGLVYQNEPGGLNEAMSDILGAVVEWSKDGQVISGDIWKVGEDIWTPGTSGDALRYMNNPTADGYSKDWYPERITGSSDNGGVHGNSGIANLAFYLTVQGGTHPRGKTSLNVPGIGMDKAARIYYRALTNYMSSNTNFAGARTATANAAAELYGTNEKYSVEAAWYAVGVGTQPTPPDGNPNPNPNPNPGTVVLSSGVGVSVPSMATGATQLYTIAVPSGSTTLTVTTSGGSGDADIYVKLGSAPTTTSYDKASEGATTAETITISAPAAGTYYILLNSYAAISGVTIKATVAGGGGGGNVLTNGVPVTGLSGATGATKTYTYSVPAGATNATFKISGGTGDADIYVKFGAAPTTTSYDYRPYLNGNNETVSVSSPTAGTWYVMVRAYSTYSGVSLVASSQ